MTLDEIRNILTRMGYDITSESFNLSPDQLVDLMVEAYVDGRAAGYDAGYDRGYDEGERGGPWV